MKFIDKKKFIVISIAALIVTILVNFPNIFNSFYTGDDFMKNGMHEFEKFKKPHPEFKFDFQIFQFLWYYIFSFILLIITSNKKYFKTKNSSSDFFVPFVHIIIIVVIFYVLESMIFKYFFGPHDFPFKRRFDAILFSRYLFVVVVSFLTGLLMKIFEEQNTIEIENEKLKSENLQIRYNALTNQMNPHFFFNSLNSLKYLLLENEADKSIKYIDELSTVFRYILQSSKKELVALSDELEFLKAYTFLLEIRFESKIRIDVHIPEDMRNCKVPVLTLQPLVENAINHNTCTLNKPLYILIRMQGDLLEVSNNLNPKLRNESGSGIGLDNLNNRFILLLNKEIRVNKDSNNFSVLLPLKGPVS
ncbi:MAG: histidine kinase [Bacteroidales bacterium]|nr:histidine kinase [Bacteroidales bacterium]